MEGFKSTKIGLIPNDWSIIKAKDYCFKVTDGTHDTPEPQSEGHFLVTSKNLTDAGIDFRDCYYISKNDFIQINARSKVDRFDVLFGMIGTVGNCTIVTQNNVNFAIKNVGLFKLNGDSVKAIWLKNYLSSSLFSNYLRKQMAGTTQQFVGLGFLRKSPIIVPKTNTDEIDWDLIKSINLVLSKVDEAIDATQNSIKAAEKLKKALMQNLLTGKLKPDGSWRTDDEFYVDEKFGKVPNGWAAGTLKDIAEVIAGQSPTGDTYNDEGKGMAMLNGPTEFTDYYPIPVQFTTKPTKICEVGDILFTVRGSSTGRMNFADQSYCIGRGIAAIRANENSDISFLYYTLVTIAHKILAQAKGAGSTFPNVNRGELNKKRVIFPIKREVQQIIGSKIKEIESLEKTKQTKIRTLQRLKKSLMQNLLTGKVRLDVEKVNKILSEE